MTTSKRLSPAEAIEAENAVAKQIIMSLVDYYVSMGKTKEETTKLVNPAINAMVEHSNVGPVLVNAIEGKINEKYAFDINATNKAIDEVSQGERQAIMAKLNRAGLSQYLDSTFYFHINR